MQLSDYRTDNWTSEIMKAMNSEVISNMLLYTVKSLLATSIIAFDFYINMKILE